MTLIIIYAHNSYVCKHNNIYFFRSKQIFAIGFDL